VSALVGILVSCAALIGPASAAAPGVTATVERRDPVAFAYDACTEGGPACEGEVSVRDQDEAIFATPAEVDCPAASAPSPTSAQAAAVEDCSPPSIDFHYRVSRSPESERPPGALRPQRTRRNVRVIAACAGLPVQHGSSLAPNTAQPIAMYAVPALRPPAARSATFEWSSGGPARTLEPLDRPPRA
jgi:hypothetical protein